MVINRKQEHIERNKLNKFPCTLGDGLELSEIEVPGAAVGRTLEELRLPDRHALTVLAVRRPTSGEPRVLLPRRDVELHAGDVLVVVGEPGSAKTYVVGS